MGMTRSTEVDSAKRWRDKYLALVEQHDRTSQQQETQHDQLRRGLVMVSLLADGQESSVDSALSTLRDALKPGANGMEKAMSELERSVKRFEQKNQAQAEILLVELKKAAQQLSQCPLPGPLLHRIKHVRKSAETELLSWSGYINQLQSWIQILADIATLDGYDEPKPKWWQRWFRPDPEQTEEYNRQHERHALDHEPNVITSNDQEPLFSHIAQDVSETLLNLHSQLVIPERLGESAHSLQIRLGKGLHWFELVPLLEDTAELLIDCLGSGQQEFERFLKNLDERLIAIQSLVTDAHQGQQEREQARQELDSLVRHQVNDIRTVVNGSEDLTALGASVSQHLALIVQAMEHYQSAEQERELRLGDQLLQLQTRLQEMEKEAATARQIIAEQRHRATHDALTSLPNRDAYQERLKAEIQRRHRYGGELSLVIADVDFFKRINDTYGHLAGDKVLQLLAKALRKYLRDVDFIARFGGEEFVILMPQTSAIDAFTACEKLRKQVENSPFNYKKEPVPITMSFGIAQFFSLEDADVVFERADKALYRAKNSGRNRCELGDTEQRLTP